MGHLGIRGPWLSSGVEMALFSTSKPVVTPGGKPLPPDIQKAMSRVTEIGSLPEIATKVAEIVEDPRASAQDVHDVVQSDPALATKILKIVNSAFYGLPSQIASLDRAIVMIGLSTVRNVALATSLSSLVKPGQISDQFEARDLWQHCVAVGVCARMLARAGKRVPPDEALVAGLVHDMGLLVVQQLFPEKVKAVVEQCQSEPQNYCALEDSVIGADHQTFAGALAAKWKFPVGLRNAVMYHHEPRSLQPELQKTPALVYVADTLCCRVQEGFWLTARTQELSDWMLQLLNIQASDIEEVCAKLPDRVSEAAEVFGD